MDVNLFCVDLFYFHMFKCINDMNRSYLSLEIVHLIIVKIIFSKTSKVKLGCRPGKLVIHDVQVCDFQAFGTSGIDILAENYRRRF